VTRWRLKILDVPLFILLSAGAAIPWMLPEEPGAVVVINHRGGEMRIDLGDERTIRLDGPVGETVVRIENGRAWVAHSDCPQKLCMKMGSIDTAGESVWCVPNGVGVRIEGRGEGGVDAVTR
jgi:hypothetical protein